MEKSRGSPFHRRTVKNPCFRPQLGGRSTGAKLEESGSKGSGSKNTSHAPEPDIYNWTNLSVNHPENRKYTGTERKFTSEQYLYSHDQQDIDQRSEQSHSILTLERSGESVMPRAEGRERGPSCISQ